MYLHRLDAELGDESPPVLNTPVAAKVIGC
jgi:hypothetical protein